MGRILRLLRSSSTWRGAHARKAWLRDNEKAVANMHDMTPRDRATVMWYAAINRRSLTLRRAIRAASAAHGRKA